MVEQELECVQHGPPWDLRPRRFVSMLTKNTETDTSDVGVQQRRGEVAHEHWLGRGPRQCTALWLALRAFVRLTFVEIPSLRAVWMWVGLMFVLVTRIQGRRRWGLQCFLYEDPQEKLCLHTNLFLGSNMNHLIDQGNSGKCRGPHSILLFTDHTLGLTQFFFMA